MVGSGLKYENLFSNWGHLSVGVSHISSIVVSCIQVNNAILNTDGNYLESKLNLSSC